MEEGIYHNKEQVIGVCKHTRLRLYVDLGDVARLITKQYIAYRVPANIL